MNKKLLSRAELEELIDKCAGTISADRISAGVISAGRIAAGSIHIAEIATMSEDEFQSGPAQFFELQILEREFWRLHPVLRFWNRCGLFSSHNARSWALSEHAKLLGNRTT